MNHSSNKINNQSSIITENTGMLCWKNENEFVHVYIYKSQKTNAILLYIDEKITGKYREWYTGIYQRLLFPIICHFIIKIYEYLI